MPANVGVLNFDWVFVQEMIFNWINVGIVAFILYSLLYKPVKKFMEDRQLKIEGEIKEAQDQLKQAESLKKDYEDKLKSIESERTEILDTARKRSQEREEQIIGEARTEAKTIKDRALLDIEREKDKAADDMKQQIIEISSLMAQRFVKDGMDDEAKKKLLDDSLTDLGDVKWPS